MHRFTAVPSVLAILALLSSTAESLNIFPNATTERVPSLFFNKYGGCPDDYEDELKKAGISAKLVVFSSFDASIRKFVGIPSQIEVNHILILGGYVFVNHVPAWQVTELLKSERDITGLVGPLSCKSEGPHTPLHAIPGTPF